MCHFNNYKEARLAYKSKGSLKPIFVQLFC